MPHNFLQVERKDEFFRKGIYMDQYDEPTYLTFSLDFDFSNQYSTPDASLTDLIDSSPLFSEDKESCYTYLKNRGFNEKAINIKKFKSILQYLTDSTPWYFQSISSLDKMWENSVKMNQGYKANDITLTVNTLEALDLRVSNLAALYNNAVFDMKYMRERVPDNMRWFNMDIWVAEFRNLRNTLPALLQLGDVSAGTLGSLGGLLGSSTGNEDSTFGNVLANFGYIKFKCRQCEFDFSKSFAGESTMNVGSKSVDMSNNTFDIKVGWYEMEYSFPSGDKLTDDWTKLYGLFGSIGAVKNLPIVGEKLSSLSNKSISNIKEFLNTPNKLVGSYAKDLQAIVEKGSLGEASPYGYISQGRQVP